MEGRGKGGRGRMRGERLPAKPNGPGSCLQTGENALYFIIIALLLFFTE